MSHYRVLVINGGGVRGVIPAVMMQYMSDKSGKDVHELFDYVIGTSVGGIIALALTVQGINGKPRYTANDVVDVFMKGAGEIFPQDSIGNWWLIGDIYHIFHAKYDREGIDTFLYHKFGNATFKDTTIPVASLILWTIVADCIITHQAYYSPCHLEMTDHQLR